MPLYDSYIKAFRWASDRLEENGVIAMSLMLDGLTQTLQMDLEKALKMNLIKYMFFI